MYNIPLFELNFSEEEVDAVVNTIRSKWISTGPRCEELEKVFCEMWHVKHAVSVDNCTNALHLAMILCGIGPGDEVLCPSLTFAASVNCIRYTGATPVFCDIESVDRINIDPAQIERSITPNTKAIVVVHLAGFPADMDAIMTIARKHRLKVIEDACHGPLSEYRGKKLGTIGDIGCFSFFSNKNISTGEGGMLITNDDAIGQRARVLRSHGMTTMSYQRASGHATEYDIVDVGYNYRMDDIRASIGVVQLGKLLPDLQKRVSVRERYLKNLNGLERVAVPFAKNREFVSNYIMPIVLRNSTKEFRNRVREAMHEAGIQTSVHYPAIHRFSSYKPFTKSLPMTEYVTDNELSLPMFAALTDEQVDFICDTLKTALDA